MKLKFQTTTGHIVTCRLLGWGVCGEVAWLANTRILAAYIVIDFASFSIKEFTAFAITPTPIPCGTYSSISE